MKQKLQDNRHIIVTMTAVIMALFLAALDQTIVATALPRIVKDFNGLDQISWVFTAYMLASTVSTPIIGKLSDIYGRKIFYLAGITIFLIGSILCGAAQNMTQLILFRGLQGLGGGAIFVNTFAIIGDLFPPAQRGKWQGLLGAAFGIASVVGPLLGGWLTDNLSWRWVFYVNIPVGLIALGIIWTTFHAVKHNVKDRSIDILGSFTLAVALVTLLLGFVWGGSKYVWTSWQIIGLFLTSAIFFVTFVYAELKAREPVLPLSLFKNKTFTVSMLITFLSGMGMFGAITYLPLFAQEVIHFSATNSGLVLTPMMLGWVTASAIVGQIITRTGKYKVAAIFGCEITVLGMFLLSRMTSSTTSTQLIIDMLILGIGMGISFPIFLIAVQNAVDFSKLGVVSAATQLFRSTGGTVGVAIMGSILNNQLAKQLSDISSDPFIQTMSKLNPNANFNAFDINKIQVFLSTDVANQIQSMIKRLPPPLSQTINDQYQHFREILINAMATSITDVFTLATICLIIMFLLSFFLPELPLRKSHEPAAQQLGEEMDIAGGQSEPRDEPKPIFSS